MKRDESKAAENLFFFPSFFFSFLFTFRKPLKLSQGLPKLKFLPGKKAKITPEKKSGKVTLPLSEKNFPVTPLVYCNITPGCKSQTNVIFGKNGSLVLNASASASLNCFTRRYFVQHGAKIC